jgi:glucosyl-3-phosphoglycerate synthase
MILDICKKWGLDVIAQVDLDRRIHRNQDTKALGKMSFAIIKTFLNRIEKQGLIDLNENIFKDMIQYNLVKNEYQPDIFRIEAVERPPIIEIPEYREKFNIPDQILELKGPRPIDRQPIDRQI